MQITRLSVTVLAGASNQVAAHGLERVPDMYYIVQPDEGVVKASVKSMNFAAVGAAIALNKANVKTVSAAVFTVDGVFYAKAATDDFWILGAGPPAFNVTNLMYNVCLLCIDTLGAMQIGPGTEAATLAGVVLPDLPALSAVVATLEVHPTGAGNFVGGTTELDDAGVVPTAVFNDVSGHPDMFGEVSFGNVPDDTNIYLNNSMQQARAVEVFVGTIHSLIA